MGDYSKEAEMKGADPTQQFLYGTIGGIGEVTLNRLLGIIPGYKKLFEGQSTNVLKDVLKKCRK